MFYRNYCLKIALQKIFKYMKLKMAAAAVEQNYRYIEGFRLNCFWSPANGSVQLMFTKS